MNAVADLAEDVRGSELSPAGVAAGRSQRRVLLLHLLDPHMGHGR